MYIFNQNDSNISIDDWIKACLYEPDLIKSGLTKIENKDSIVFMSLEELKEICDYLSGKKEIPPLENAEDVLGDIEECDLNENIVFEYFETTTIEEIYKGVTDTRGIYTEHTIVRMFENIGTFGEFEVTKFEGRKGYPSIIWGRK